MLIFSRKPGECFQIGNNVTVTVRRIAGNRVTLSFDAPASVRIARKEAAGREVLCEVVLASEPEVANPVQACV
ncbi:MAG TPA: carbon storage regulator [Pirellulales bacterium]|jgi:carbon storage regulator|nr:carbon storage regulator [Pirellulales bacterium]